MKRYAQAKGAQTKQIELIGQEQDIFLSIISKTNKSNLDNISRTKAYQSYYFRNPEITWALLASMVSRNAGWNMCDLVTTEYRTMLHLNYRRWLFFTYERANWLIFADAYPQLLLYEYSKKINKPLFNLLPSFSVSRFMESEWENFWSGGSGRLRINTALIVNEQNLIQKPVVENIHYNHHVFSTIPYGLQDWMHFNTVLFPTVEGDLFGLSVHGFRYVTKRIRLGRRLHKLLFHPKYKQRFMTFAKRTEPTGRRYDYEQYLKEPRKGHRFSLRSTYPIIEHHRGDRTDWSLHKRYPREFTNPIALPKNIHLNDWYAHKRMELHVLAKWTSRLTRKKWG